MWELENYTPFAAERTWVRDREGAEVWLVAVKGTFDVNPDGSTTVAKDQVEVCIAPKYSGESGKSSVLYDSDLPLTKVTTDVIVNGHAYAPKGEPARKVKVAFHVAGLSKSLWVVGDSFWRGALFGFVPTRTVPFVKVPITYERAYGGMDANGAKPKWDPRNPVGTGVASRRRHLAGQRRPNVYDKCPGLFSMLRRARPAGFGVIAAHWTPRVKLAGTCDAKWQKQQAPLLPQDFDDRFYQSAPPDQQTEQFLVGGEEVHLRNLTPSGDLSFRLPRAVLGFETDFGAKPVRHRAKLHTVILEPDAPRVILVWHTALECHSKGTKLKATRITQKAIIKRRESDAQQNQSEVEEGMAYDYGK
jgi:hypothetical protein